MARFEFYRANASYFGKIFRYRYTSHVKFLLKLLLLGLIGLIVLFTIDHFAPQSIFLKNLTLKLVIIVAIMAILGISIFAILLALRYIYITGYSLLKQEQEIPTVVRIFRKIFFLDYPLKLVIIGVIVFLLFFLLLYVVVSLFLYSKFDIPFL